MQSLLQQPYVQYGLQKLNTTVAHRVPYGYGDWAVAFVTNRWAQYVKDSAAREITEAHRLRLAEEAVARGDQLSVYPDWCDHGSSLFAYVCEQYIDSPIWCTVFVLDGVAIWLIICILRRQHEQNSEERRARSAVQGAARARRLWKRLSAVARVASLGLKWSEASSGDRAAHWRKSYEEVAKARDNRKKYLWKKDFDLMGVMGRGLGPVVMLFCSLLILYETHSWFTVILPHFGLPPRCFFLVACVTAIVPGRIYLDYFRTSFTDPGNPQAVSPRGGAVGATCQGQQEGDIELAGPESSEVKKCFKCGGPKPRRCHHCKVCRRCVLKMDHHCPFVNNCVGLRNHRFFILFLLELVIGCSALLVFALPQLLSALRNAPQQTLAHRVHVISTFAVALIANSMLSPFFYFHMQLVIINETTLENMKGRNFRMEQRMKQKQLQRSLEKAEKAGDSQKAEEIKAESQAQAAKDDAQRKHLAEEKLRYSRGSFIENFSEVFGAPPAAWRKRVEAVLEWFNPAPKSGAAPKKRSA